MTVHTRRAALAVLATAAAATPLLLATRSALAQTAPTAAPDPQAYSDYVMQTMTIGGMALQSSQIAVDKAQDPMVKEFAQLEVGEQTAVATVLSSTGATPPPMPDDMKAKLQSLQDAAAGPDFDSAYVDAQLDGHQQLLKVQQTISKAMDATVEVITAKLAEQSVMTHVAMLNHIKEQMGAGSNAGVAAQPAGGGSSTPSTPGGGSSTPAPAGSTTPAAPAGGASTPAPAGSTPMAPSGGAATPAAPAGGASTPAAPASGATPAAPSGGATPAAPAAQ